MDDSGCIRVTAKQEEVTAWLQMSDGEISPGRYVCIVVGDNGRGFDERVARRMFEPFFTTCRAGTGLGRQPFVKSFGTMMEPSASTASRARKPLRSMAARTAEPIWLRWSSRSCCRLGTAKRS